MSNLTVSAGAKRAELRAVITRADGTVEDLGVIAYHHKNKIRHWIGNTLIGLLRKKKRGT